MASSPITSWQIEGERWKYWQISSSWALKSLQMVTAAMKSEDVCFLAGNLLNLCWKAEILLCRQDPYSQGYGFPVVMYGCESWMVKKEECWRMDSFKLWCWRRLLRVPWTARKITQVNLNGNQSWILIVLRTDVEAETPVFWSSDANGWLIEKVPDDGKDWGQKEKSASEDQMAGWHRWWNGHEL